MWLDFPRSFSLSDENTLPALQDWRVGFPAYCKTILKTLGYFVTFALATDLFPRALWRVMEPVVPTRHIDDEPPPFLGRWDRVYLAVGAYLVVLIAVLYILTRLFSR